MSDPLVSVVMALNNVESYLREALGSITKQSYTNYEVILMDAD